LLQRRDRGRSNEWDQEGGTGREKGGRTVEEKKEHGEENRAGEKKGQAEDRRKQAREEREEEDEDSRPSKKRKLGVTQTEEEGRGEEDEDLGWLWELAGRLEDPKEGGQVADTMRLLVEEGKLEGLDELLGGGGREEGAKTQDEESDEEGRGREDGGMDVEGEEEGVGLGGKKIRGGGSASLGSFLDFPPQSQEPRGIAGSFFGGLGVPPQSQESGSGGDLMGTLGGSRGLSFSGGYHQEGPGGPNKTTGGDRRGLGGGLPGEDQKKEFKDVQEGEGEEGQGDYVVKHTTAFMRLFGKR
jgi:hypothetical protein